MIELQANAQIRNVVEQKYGVISKDDLSVKKKLYKGNFYISNEK